VARGKKDLTNLADLPAMMSKASSDEIMHLFGADVVSLHGPLKQFADEIGMTTFVDMLQTGDSVLEAEWKFDVASQHELLDIQKLMVTTNRALQRFAAKPLKVLIYSFGQRRRSPKVMRLHPGCPIRGMGTAQQDQSCRAVIGTLCRAKTRGRSAGRSASFCATSVCKILGDQAAFDRKGGARIYGRLCSGMMTGHAAADRRRLDDVIE
jgi:hypothetical protein